MATKKSVNVNDFYTKSFEDYVNHLQNAKQDAGKPLMLKANVKDNDAINSVEKLINGKNDKSVNKNLLKIIAKKGVKPTIKKVYQNVLVTLFKTNEVEYDYSYTLNGDTINMSPKRISINEGYAEFTTATQCFVGEVGKANSFSYPWGEVSDDMLTDSPDPDYAFAIVGKSDYEKDSKESMRQYNEQLKDWVKDFQQKELGKARQIYSATVYDKDYDFNEIVLLVPYILVSYDLGNMIVTFPVCGITGSVETPLLNNPSARFEYDEEALPPSFSIPICLIASVCMVVLGGVLYTMWYMSKKLTFNSKSLKGYTLPELRKLL